MRLLNIDTTPLTTIPYLTAPSGRGAPDMLRLPILTGTVDALPEGLDAVLMTADLQGHGTAHPRRLLGHVLAEQWSALCGREGLDPKRVGVVLAGDLYALPDLKSRGGLGDVDAVWWDFAARARWVVGVAGNHDQFHGRTSVLGAFADVDHVHPLDGDEVTVDGLTVVGVSGIIGRSHKPWRLEPDRWTTLVERLLEAQPDLLVLHQGPDADGRLGSEHVRQVLEASRACPLVVFGHCHWHKPTATLRGGTQLLNVDGRAVLLRAA